MNFMTEWNRMYDFCMSNKLSKSEILILHALYMVNNKKDWDVWFEADNHQIQRLTGGLSRQSITEARNKLKQRGRIEFREGKKNQQSPAYRIIPFFSKLDIQGDIEVDIQGDIEVDIQGDHIKNKLNQTKTKPEKKENGADAPAYCKRGSFGWVKLTDAEYGRLISEYGKDVAEHYIAYVDECAEQTGNKNKWKNWNLTVRKAIRNKWGGSFTGSKADNSTGNVFFDMLREEGKY